MSDRMEAMDPPAASARAVAIGNVLEGGTYADNVAALAITTAHFASMTSSDQTEALTRIDEWAASCKRVILGVDPMPWWPKHPGDGA